jgi:inner membrane protein
MQRLLGSKIMMIGVLIIAFLIGFTFIRAMIYERQQNSQQVVKDIIRDNVNSQTVLTPFIVVPISTSFICADDKNKTCYKRQQLVITPEQTKWKNNVKVDDQRFKRGIYKAISYQNQMNITGEFSVPDQLLHPAANQEIDWDKATVRLYLSDPRGLSQAKIKINTQNFDLQIPKDEAFNPIHNVGYSQVVISNLRQTPHINFSLSADIAGTGSFQILPLGDNLAVQLNANWPHPSFYGESLPIKQLYAQGFTANWQNTFLSSRNTRKI